MGFVKSLIWILIISLILSGCDDREEYELVLDNPFDPDNPQTSGDPFQLSVQTEGRKSILKWNVPEIDFEKYIIYRQEDDAGLIQHAGGNYCRFHLQMWHESLVLLADPPSQDNQVGPEVEL